MNAKTSTDAHAWIRDWRRRADKTLLDSQSLARRMESLSLTAVNKQRNVLVTVDGNGAVQELRLEKSIQNLPADAIAAEIMNTMRRAQAQLVEAARQVVKATVGVESEIGKAALASFCRRFESEAELQEGRS
ncbi:MAG: YbaB/EbfC family nucleoid-associated protein [Stackebrandtia sp.]